MTKLLKPAVLAGLALAAPFAAAPAAAQSSAAAITTAPVQGIGYAQLDSVVANSNAFRTAQTQRQTTYKAQIDQARARQSAIQAQLTPLVDKFNRDRQANANNPALQTQAAQIQRIQDSGSQELQTILRPVALSEAYVQEQINDRLPQAVQNAMNKQRISLLLNPQAILSAANGYNLNQAILNEINTLLPSATLVPPAGWLPREVREQQAQQGQAARPAAAAPAAPAGRAPEGR